MVLVVSLEIKVMWLFICVGFSSAFTDDDARGLVPGRALALKPSTRAVVAKGPQMSAGGFVPDMGRRQLMNAFLLGSIAGPVLVLPAVLISFLTPAPSGGGGMPPLIYTSSI